MASELSVLLTGRQGLISCLKRHDSKPGEDRTNSLLLSHDSRLLNAWLSSLCVLMEVIRSYLEAINEAHAEGYLIHILKTLSPHSVITPLVVIVKSAEKD